MKERFYMAKGSKRNRWCKDGIKVSRAMWKKYLSRKVRRCNKALSNGSYYKKVDSDKLYNYIP